jgi:hypothetical protein
VVLLLLLNWLYVGVVHVGLSGTQSALSRTLVYYTQVSVMALGPTAISDWMAVIFSIFQIPTSNGTCLFARSYYGRMLQGFVFPLVSGAQLLLTVLVLFVVFRVRGQIEFPLQRWLVRPLLSLLLAVYTPLSSVAMEVLNCLPISSSGRSLWVVASAPAVRCSGDVYSTYKAVAVLVVVLFMFGLPLFAGALWLWLRRSGRAVTEFRFGFLFECYRPRCEWWEVVVLVRRTAISALTLIYMPDARAFALAVVSALVFASHAVVSPFVSARENSIEILALATIAFLAFARASSLYAEEGAVLAWVLTVVMLLPLITIALVLVWSVRARLRTVWLRVSACWRRPHVKEEPSAELQSTHTLVPEKTDETSRLLGAV